MYKGCFPWISIAASPVCDCVNLIYSQATRLLKGPYLTGIYVAFAGKSCHGFLPQRVSLPCSTQKKLPRGCSGFEPVLWHDFTTYHSCWCIGTMRPCRRTSTQPKCVMSNEHLNCSFLNFMQIVHSFVLITLRYIWRTGPGISEEPPTTVCHLLYSLNSPKAPHHTYSDIL